MQKYYAIDLSEQDGPMRAPVYKAADVDAVLKRQAAAAVAGMNAATAISRGQVEQANRLRAESSPEMLESERQANAILTARIAELEQENDTLRLAFFQMTNMAEQMRTSVGSRLKCRHRLAEWVKDGVCLMCGERTDH